MTAGLDGVGVIIIGAGAGAGVTMVAGGGAGGAVFSVQATRLMEAATTARRGRMRIRILR